MSMSRNKCLSMPFKQKSKMNGENYTPGQCSTNTQRAFAPHPIDGPSLPSKESFVLPSVTFWKHSYIFTSCSKHSTKWDSTGVFDGAPHLSHPVARHGRCRPSACTWMANILFLGGLS